MRYLSPEWIAAADRAVKSAASTAPEQSVVIAQHIEDVCSYRVTIGPKPSVQLTSPSTNDSVDASFTQDMATATAVAQGSTDSHQAFLLGHVRFEGDIHLLIERRDAFEWLAEALAPVVATTEF